MALSLGDPVSFGLPLNWTHLAHLKFILETPGLGYSNSARAPSRELPAPAFLERVAVRGIVGGELVGPGSLVLGQLGISHLRFGPPGKNKMSSSDRFPLKPTGENHFKQYSKANGRYWSKFNHQDMDRR